MFEFFSSAAANFGIYPYAQLSMTVWLLIVLALTFDFLNGMHDAANSIATVVSTRVLSPQAAVIWAAFFNFAAFLVFPLDVANRIQGGIVDQRLVHNPIDANFLIAGTLFAACAWNILTWYLGLPTSSSHALIGGLVGAAITITGDISSLKLGGLMWIVLFIVLAPTIGLVLGSSIAVGLLWILRRSTPLFVEKIFRRGQLVSAAFYSLGHGGNDAQKTMGIIFVLLIAANPNYFGLDPSQAAEGAKANRPIPTEVVLACHLAMGLGTLMGGWRIVKTMGQRIIRLRPFDGFCAETGGAITLALATFLSIPVSTTHTITGAIVGVGATKRFSAVRWGVAGRVVWAWVLTIPGAALLAALGVGILKLIFPDG